MLRAHPLWCSGLAGCCPQGHPPSLRLCPHSVIQGGSLPLCRLWPLGPGTPVFRHTVAQRGWGKLLETASPLRDWRKSSCLTSFHCHTGCYLQTCYTKLSFNRVNFPTLSLCGAFRIKRNWATLSLWCVFLGQLYRISALFSTRGLRPASQRQGDPFSARCLARATAWEPVLVLLCAQEPPCPPRTPCHSTCPRSPLSWGFRIPP